MATVAAGGGFSGATTVVLVELAGGAEDFDSALELWGEQPVANSHAASAAPGRK